MKTVCADAYYVGVTAIVHHGISYLGPSVKIKCRHYLLTHCWELLTFQGTMLHYFYLFLEN